MLDSFKMAERALKKVEDHLICSICLDTYTDPKLLQCFHVNCKQCLVPLVDRDPRGQLFLPCPTCRHPTPVPAGGVACLQAAFNLNPILEIVGAHKKDAALSENRDSGEASIGKSGESASCLEEFCPAHPDKHLELYCESCCQLICYRCAIKGGQHHSHDYASVHDAFEESKAGIAASLEAVEGWLPALGGALEQLDTRSGEILNQQAVVKSGIRYALGQFRQALKARETVLCKEVDQISQSKLKGLGAQRDRIETAQAQCSSYLHCVREGLTLEKHGVLLKMKTAILNQAKELDTLFKPDFLETKIEADITFAAPNSACQSYGEVRSPSLLDASKCRIVAPQLAALVGEECTITLHTSDFRGRPCEEPIKSLDCELVSELSGDRVDCAIERRQNVYDIRFRPSMKGRHQLHVRISGQHVSGSPVIISVTLPVGKLGVPFRMLPVAGPWGVVVNQGGQVIVTEYQGHCVSMFNRSGKRIRKFGSHGSGEGQFRHPAGVAVDSEGSILVVDSHNHRVQKFSAEGDFLAAVNPQGRKSPQLDYPLGLAVNSTNEKLYVVDHNGIHVLNPNLTAYKTFGKKGNNMGQFSSPWDVACDSAGKVYVADSENCRVQVFSPEGSFLRVFGGRHSNQGVLARPRCLAVASDGLVYVTDEVSHRVSVFTPQGELVTAFGKEGSRPGEFAAPRGIALDSDGVVYVCDRENSRVQLF